MPHLKEDYTCTPFQNIGLSTAITVPKGTKCKLVKSLNGGAGDGWVIDDVPLLIKLTGNSHDPVYRYVEVPAELVSGTDMQPLTSALQVVKDQFKR